MSRGDNLGQNEQKSLTPIIVAAIGAVAVIVAAVIGVFANRPPPGPPNPSLVAPPGPRRDTAQTPPSSSIPPPTGFGPAVQIIEPTQDKSVGHEAGTEVTGTASNLGGESLWLFDLSEGPTHGFAYYRESDQVPVVNGKWGSHLGQIGSPGGEREVVTIIAVLADKNCETMIKALLAKPEVDQYFQDDLPPGCDGRQASVRVVKDHG